MPVFHKRAMKNGGVYYESVDYEAIAREYFHYTDPDRRDWYTLPPVLREDRVRAVRLAIETVLDDRSVYPKEANEPDHLFGIKNGDCEHCGVKPWQSEQPCVYPKEAERD